MIRRLFISSITIVLLTPYFFQWSGYQSNFTLQENRRLSELPEWNSQELKNYFLQLDEYINDHFPLRKELIRLYTNFQFFILKKSPFPSKVIVGKDNWLFLGESKMGVVSLHDGTYPLSQSQLEIIRNNVIEKHNWLKERGIGYMLLIAPDKHSIYSQNLPSYIDRNKIDEKYDQLKSVLKEEVNFIDVKPDLRRHIKDSPTDLYLKYDSHWSDYGAFVAYQSIIEQVRLKYPRFNLRSPFNFGHLKQERKTEIIKTSADMINMQDYLSEQTLELYWKRNLVSLDKNRLKPPSTYRGLPQLYEKRFRSYNRNGLKILLFRDSFSNRLMKFLSAHFDETLFINGHQFDRDLILREKPDLVIHEIVERAAIPVLLKYR